LGQDFFNSCSQSCCQQSKLLARAVALSPAGITASILKVEGVLTARPNAERLFVLALLLDVLLQRQPCFAS
jgi:hypothetical protein